MAMPKAQRIQQSITTRLNQLKEQNILTPKDFDDLYNRTRHGLYELAGEAEKKLKEANNKLEEIKKIIERK
jgi:hypothetical protein